MLDAVGVSGVLFTAILILDNVRVPRPTDAYKNDEIGLRWAINIAV